MQQPSLSVTFLYWVYTINPGQCSSWSWLIIVHHICLTASKAGGEYISFKAFAHHMELGVQELTVFLEVAYLDLSLCKGRGCGYGGRPGGA